MLLDKNVNPSISKVVKKTPKITKNPALAFLIIVVAPYTHKIDNSTSDIATPLFFWKIKKNINLLHKNIFKKKNYLIVSY